MYVLLRKHSASRKCILLQWAVWVALRFYGEDGKIRFVVCSFSFLKLFYSIFSLHIVEAF